MLYYARCAEVCADSIPLNLWEVVARLTRFYMVGYLYNLGRCGGATEALDCLRTAAKLSHTPLFQMRRWTAKYARSQHSLECRLILSSPVRSVAGLVRRSSQVGLVVAAEGVLGNVLLVPGC